MFTLFEFPLPMRTDDDQERVVGLSHLAASKLETSAAICVGKVTKVVVAWMQGKFILLAESRKP